MIAFDTDPAAHQVQIQVYRRLGPEARLRRALEMCDDVRLVARSGIRARHPAYSDLEVNLALFRLVLGDALYQAAYHGQPLLESMTTGGVLSRVIGHLEQANIPSMVAGSFASTYHGVPRTTNDIDIVIAPTAQTLAKFLDRLSEQEYYVSREAAMDALRRNSMFNVIDLESGWKVDLIIRKSRPFSLEEFRRRMAARLFEVPVFVATAEDTILTKLEWAAMGESERQVRDAAGIVSVKATELDREYISRWANELGVAEQWHRLIKEGL